MSQKVHLVVARFDEDLEYCLNALDAKVVDEVFVYNKGQPLSDERYKRADFHDVAIENRGLDQLGHVQYVIDTYNSANPADVVCFAQGRVDDHLDVYEPSSESGNVKIINLVSYAAVGMSSVELVRRLVAQAVLHGASFNGRTYADAMQRPMTVGEFQCPEQWGEQKTGMVYREWFAKHIDAAGPPPDAGFKWFKNSIFAVKGGAIRSRPIADYEAISEQLRSVVRGEVVHYMERSWFYLLNLHRSIAAHRPATVVDQAQSPNTAGAGAAPVAAPALAPSASKSTSKLARLLENL